MGAFTAVFAPFGYFIGGPLSLTCSQLEGQARPHHGVRGDGVPRRLLRALRLCNFCSRTHREETLVQVSLLKHSARRIL